MSFLQSVDYPMALNARVWKKGPRNAKSKMHALMLQVNKQPGGKRLAVSRQAIQRSCIDSAGPALRVRIA